MLCYVMLCYVMLCYVMLCYVMLCYVMLCYVMLWYAMLCCFTMHNVIFQALRWMPLAILGIFLQVCFFIVHICFKVY